jgi:peptide/nickel transport system substrate-binding protein
MKARVFYLVLFLALFAVSISYAQDSQFGESPLLAERVAAGTLPPVAERLPANPRVVSLPGSSVGSYGGDFRDPFVGDSFWSSQMVFWTFWKGLVNWNPTYSGWEPNIADDVQVSEDARVYTFHIREGIRWSDGVPFTSDDVIFVINDILGLTEHPPKFSKNFLRDAGDIPGAMQKFVADVKAGIFPAIEHSFV